MRFLTLPAAAVLLLVAHPLNAQVSDAALREVMRDADATPTAASLLRASNAARLMRDYDAAEGYLDRAWDASGPVFNGLVNNAILFQLASGGGVGGAQRAFYDLRQVFHFTPVQISGISGNYPELLAGGEFDDMILRLSPDATDPQYRCACYNTQAWVHRLAGRHAEAAGIWATLVDGQIATVNATTDKDAEAQVRGQYARNLARAGEDAEARRQLEMSMDTEVSEGALPAVRRRWAQAFAELGDVEGAVEQLEPLLEANSLITIHTLESRVAWALVRDAPEFQALLARHR